MRLIDYLLENGGSSIQYRVRKEMLKESPNNSEMLKLQGQIWNNNKVKKLMKRRHADGWIGDTLHGAPGDGLDSSITFLLGSGIEKDCQIMNDVASALLSDKEDVEYRTTFKGGEALDEGGRGGNNAVKAGILAELGREDNALVQNEIETSISYLEKSLEYQGIDDFSVINKKGIRYYKPDVHFPGANHLNLLATTQSWRNEANYELVKKSLAHCMKIVKGKDMNIMFKHKTYFIGPFNFKWNVADFNINDIQRDTYALVWWLRTLYNISKIGIVKDIPELKQAYDYLLNLVETGDILNKQTEMSLKRFKHILAIENSWRKQESIYCDVMFYALITLFNAECEVGNIEVK